MAQKSSGSQLASFAVIAVIVAVVAGAFAYTAGWLSPDRLTSSKLVGGFCAAGRAGARPSAQPRQGHLLHRRVRLLNGTRARSSRRAQVFVEGQYPVIGRFNFSTTDPNAPDATSRVRGMGLQISTPFGDVWRIGDDQSAVLPGGDAGCVLCPAAGLGQQGSRCDEELRRRASGDRRLRRLGRERALDRLLCRGAL